MRVGKYLIENNIGLESINQLCDYLHLDHVKASTLLSEAKISLLNASLNSENFENWLQARMILDQIEIKDAKNIIKPLFYNSTTHIDELLGERILNSLLLLINRNFYSKVKESLILIIFSSKSILEKITQLRLAEPFTEPKKTFIRKRVTRISNSNIINDHDPYENFHWGGLSGGEAYIGYWNSD